MSKTVKTKAAEAAEPVRLKKRSYWGEVWHRLKKNPVSIICLVFLVVLIGAILLSPWIAPYDYTESDLTLRYALPSAQHIMGCDDHGRDLFSRLLVGGRYSLMVAVISVAIGIVFGMIVGALCGFFGKLTDNILMRFMDVIMAIPGMMMAICISVSLGSGVWQTALAIAVGTIPVIARQLRGSIMAIAGLSFIGLGVQPPTPEWGNILNNGMDNLYEFATRWHVIVFPALFIILTMLAFNLLGDGLRDAMDPRMRK